MPQSPVQLLKKYLREKDISPWEFSQLSGMPETEVQGVLEGNLPITILRAHHLAVTFDTDVETWLNRDIEKQKGDNSLNSRPKQPSIVGDD